MAARARRVGRLLTLTAGGGVLLADGSIGSMLLGGAFDYVVSAVVALGALIFIHELGHFLVAKAMGVGVERFSLGFGPRIFSFRRGETEYCVSIVPLGGYVKMTGEEAHRGGRDPSCDRRAAHGPGQVVLDEAALGPGADRLRRSRHELRPGGGDLLRRVRDRRCAGPRADHRPGDAGLPGGAGRAPAPRSGRGARREARRALGRDRGRGDRANGRPLSLTIVRDGARQEVSRHPAQGTGEDAVQRAGGGLEHRRAPLPPAGGGRGAARACRPRTRASSLATASSR